jgi:Bacterial Ig-like domain
MNARKRDLRWCRDLERLEDRQMLSLVLAATNISAVQGQAFNGAVATLFDTDLTAKPSDFTARINWGNGQQQTTGQVVGTLFSGVFQVDGTYTYPAGGAFTTQISVSDNSGQNVVASGSAAVVSAISSQLTIAANAVTGTAGQAVSNVTVATFIDPNPSDTAADFKAIIEWGDGNSSLGLVVPGGPNQFTVTGSNTYASPGTFATTITVVGVGSVPGGSATGTANISAPTGFALTGQPIVAPAGQALNNVVVATITDPVSTDTADLFTARISWGDGQVSQGNVTAKSGGFNVTGSHIYATPGSFPITVTLGKQAGDTFSTTSTASIPNAEINVGFSGGLAPITGNGPNAVEGYTNTNRPTFSGTSAPFAIVQLYARYLNADAELPLGEAVASANGQWTLTTGPLARGVSVVTAVVTIPAGYPSTTMTLSNQNGTNLVYIDLAPAPVKRPPHRMRHAPHPKIHTSKPAMLKPHGPRHL